uniref:Uncharacterized protein n=1 Tax=Aegilops tauschii subsp. strangulata TaxID=200361 RepID=A0A453ACP0_AEGTS
MSDLPAHAVAMLLLSICLLWCVICQLQTDYCNAISNSSDLYTNGDSCVSSYINCTFLFCSA